MIKCDNNFEKTHKKFIKHFYNGTLRNLILWIISKESKIHGYAIMKKLDNFFESNEDFKIRSSKVYPILRKMEKNKLILGNWRINENNKPVKYYSITSKGNDILKSIRLKFSKISSNPYWIEFFEDMYGVKINHEKCN